ncbi:cell division protein FtsB [Thiopseudomonas denitrificans]|uniref:Cell division protein FtsB n=1 Tax=Thiopseudomonas denitrificans TaxID=1501432 RepID=A0A4R6U2B6_9GAMM|nr:cell division protein FtsB [Thiopseudomonas denitrificans]TDQ38579.1 cell division protein FtsB [Thiopseudomonas denitrificans]
MKKLPLVILVVFALLLAGVQYRLWFGEGGIAEVNRLRAQIAEQQAENERLLERNRVIEAEVMELKQGMETVEERARHELGMVREGETLYLLME